MVQAYLVFTVRCGPLNDCILRRVLQFRNHGMPDEVTKDGRTLPTVAVGTATVLAVCRMRFEPSGI